MAKKTLETAEIRLLLLYEFKLGSNAAQAADRINSVWDQAATSERAAQRWFKKFREGDISLDNSGDRGADPQVDDEVLRELVEANPRVTIREIAYDLGVKPSTVSRHLKKIGKVKKLDKWVPHELTESQKMHRYQVCFSLLLRNKNEPFLERIITCDEKWIMYDNGTVVGQR